MNSFFRKLFDRRSTNPPQEARKKLGNKGERLAEKYLKKQGLKPVARNLTNRAGELDLVMLDDDTLVIIEIRTVRRLSPGFEVQSRVPASKKRQVVRVSRNFINSLPEPIPPVRYDVCVIVMEPEISIHHFPGVILPNKFT